MGVSASSPLLSLQALTFTPGSVSVKPVNPPEKLHPNTASPRLGMFAAGHEIPPPMYAVHPMTLAKPTAPDTY